MLNYKFFLVIIAIIIGFIGYAPYFRDIFRGTTKPHAFSWFVWGVLTAIAFSAQLAEGGGAGAWVTGVTVLTCFIISGTALKYGEKDIKPIDWLSLAGAGIGLLFWKFTSDPVLAVILVTVIDAVGFIPTFRKAYHKPREETVSMFSLSSLKFVIALFALESFTLSTWLYPASLALTNGLFVAMILVRRKHK